VLATYDGEQLLEANQLKQPPAEGKERPWISQ
jgi:hypothetical protein